MKHVIVSGAFDNIRSRDLRFLEEAAKLGELTVLLWPDALFEKLTGKKPQFPLVERLYFLNALRHVSRVIEAGAEADVNALPKNLHIDIWADVESPFNAAHEEFARSHKLEYRVFKDSKLSGFPELPPLPTMAGRKKIVVTEIGRASCRERV